MKLMLLQGKMSKGKSKHLGQLFIPLFQATKMSLVVYGDITRSFYSVWKQKADSNNQLSAQNVLDLFHDMNIYPSGSQVYEMLQCAKTCSKRNDNDYLTFGETCVFAATLMASYKTVVPLPLPLSTRTVPNVSHLQKCSNRSSKYEVFLGGSCNPTTWRTDTAIPALKRLGVTYYNPQVSQWGPELIELENQAKQNAEVLLFVIDNQTRGIASSIEAAYIAGNKRSLVLVVNKFPNSGVAIMGENLTEKELQEMQTGRYHLQDIVERNSIPVFNDIPMAVSHASRILGETPQKTLVPETIPPVKMGHVLLGDPLFKLREVFDELDVNKIGEITLSEVCLAFKILTRQEIPVEFLKEIVNLHESNIQTYPYTNIYNLESVKVSFDQFCAIMTEFRTKLEKPSQMQELIVKLSAILLSLIRPFLMLLEYFFPRLSANRHELRSHTTAPFSSFARHIYLGGSDAEFDWREAIAIPLLKKKGLTHRTIKQSSMDERLTPLVFSAIENCSVLMFAITSETRALSTMCLAAYYIGMGCKVVLCIQYLQENAVIDGEMLSCQAIKDYNRGRVYLSDFANQNGTPVFDDISEAVNCAIAMCIH